MTIIVYKLILSICILITITAFIVIKIRKRKNKLSIERIGGLPSIGPRLDVVEAQILPLISGLVDSTLDKLLSTPIKTSNCELIVSHIDVAKCFPKLGVSGSVDGGGVIVKDIEKTLCYTTCYSSPVVEARWAYCKFTSSDCPPHYCRDKCSKLISWSASLNSIVGMDKIHISNVKYVNTTSENRVHFHSNFMTTITFRDSIHINGSAGLSGALTLIPGLVDIPTNYNVDMELNDLSVDVIFAFNILCNNSTNKPEYQDVSIKSISMKTDNIDFHINSDSLNPIVKVSEALANDILDGFKSEWQLVLNQYVLPSITGILSNELASLTKVKGLKLVGQCINVV